MEKCSLNSIGLLLILYQPKYNTMFRLFLEEIYISWDLNIIKRLVLMFTTICTFILASYTTSDAGTRTEILVAAASSMTPALTEIATEFEKVNKDIQITFSFGSSRKVAQQIKGGAPVDVFISASSSDMDKLEKDQKIE